MLKAAAAANQHPGWSDYFTPAAAPAARRKEGGEGKGKKGNGGV